MEVLALVMEKSLCKMGCEGYLGNSLLHYAAQHGHLDIMKYLLDNENDPNARNQLSETPLQLAAGAHIKRNYKKNANFALNLILKLENC